MTLAESCEVAVVTLKLSAALRERDEAYQQLTYARGFQLVARAAIHHAHEQHVEIKHLRQQLAALREELRRYVRGQVKRVT